MGKEAQHKFETAVVQSADFDALTVECYCPLEKNGSTSSRKHKFSK